MLNRTKALLLTILLALATTALVAQSFQYPKTRKVDPPPSSRVATTG